METVSGGPSWTTTPTTDTLPTLSLAAGATGSFNFVITNSASRPNYYFDLPTGLEIVNIYNTAIGEVLSTQFWTAEDTRKSKKIY